MPALERTPGSDTLTLDGVPFAHNISIPGIGQTAPLIPLTTENGICRAALRDLNLAFPEAKPWNVKIADLGCLDGGYSIAFAQAGYDVTGIDARPENIRNSKWAAGCVGVNAKFLQADVRDVFTVPDSWDAVFCCGVLYHLNEPVKFLNQLGKAVRRLLIVQTHYSTSPYDQNEGRYGHWYTECDQRESSWGNQGSFWLGREHLMAAIRDAGFDLVFEQVDYLEDIVAGGETAPDKRGMFVGIKNLCQRSNAHGRPAHDRTQPRPVPVPVLRRPVRRPRLVPALPRPRDPARRSTREGQRRKPDQEPDP